MTNIKIPLTLFAILSFNLKISSQNVGIGTTTPGFPLSFASTLGDKIALWGNSGSHYGFGIQSGLLQIHSDAALANIGFGYGSSSSFTERMRIINSGDIGIQLNGRMTLKNGTNPLDLNYGTGLWMYKADNTALLGFMGVQNNQNLGFYGGPAGWGLTYDAINSRVGIGNSNPNAPLAFPPALGKKITLYPGATGDVGFAVAGNRLQIYSDNPNADVAIGYDAFGNFIERFAFKPNGALAIIGNTGVSGQVITSNGNTSFAQWKYPTNILYQNTAQVFQSGFVDVNTSTGILDLTGLTYTFTIPSNGKALISFNVDAYAPYCFACGVSIPVIYVYVDNNSTMTYVGGQITNTFSKTVSGSYLAQLGPGTHTIKLRGATYIPSEPIRFQPGNTSSNMIVQVMLE